MQDKMAGRKMRSTSFPAKVRSGGSPLKNLLIYIPKQVEFMLDLTPDDQLEVTINKIEVTRKVEQS